MVLAQDVKQDTTNKESETSDIYHSNHFSAELNNGFNSAKYQLLSGTDKPLRRVSYIHNLKIEYVFNNQRHWGFGLGVGLGLFSLIEKIAPKGPYSNMDLNYFEEATYVVFGRLSTSLKYYQPLSKKYTLKSNIDLGALFFFEEGVGVGGGIGGGPTSMVQYEVQYEFTNPPKPYVGGYVGIDKTLKNKDLLGIKLGFEYQLKPVLQGTFEMYNATSKGIIVNRGSNLNIGVNYVLTGNHRRNYIKQRLEKDSISFTVAKQEYKKERRTISPRSVFIAASVGTFGPRTQAESRSGQYKSGSSLSGNVRFAVEKGLKKDFFAEIDLGYNDYMTSLYRKGDWIEYGSWVFDTYQISLGMGKRLISKKNKRNRLNLHAGLALDFLIYEDLGYSGASMSGKGQLYPSYRPSMNQPGFSFIAEDYILKKTIGSLYLGASKDFLITRRFYLFLSYRFNLGLWRVLETRIRYEEGNGNPKAETLYMNGTSHSFNFGIKYRLRL